MQRAKALALKEFIDRELPGGRVIVELARDSTAGYKVEYQPTSGEGFTLEDIRSSEAFVKGFQCGRGQLRPAEGTASVSTEGSPRIPDGADTSVNGNEPELAEAGSGRGRAR